MKKLLDKLNRLEKRLEAQQNARNEIQVFIAERLDNGTYDCTATTKGGVPPKRFSLSDYKALIHFLETHKVGVALIDEVEE